MLQTEFDLNGSAKIKEGAVEEDKRRGKRIICVKDYQIAAAIDERNKHRAMLDAFGCTINAEADRPLIYAVLTFGNAHYKPNHTLKEKVERFGPVIYNFMGRAITQKAENIVNFLGFGGIDFSKEATIKLSLRGNQSCVQFWEPGMLEEYKRRGYEALEGRVKSPARAIATRMEPDQLNQPLNPEPSYGI